VFARGEPGETRLPLPVGGRQVDAVNAGGLLPISSADPSAEHRGAHMKLSEGAVKGEQTIANKHQLV